MTILITGGCGYIGSHTAVCLMQAGHEVVVLDNYSNAKRGVVERIRALAGRDFPLYECEVRDGAALDQIFSCHAIEGVIHFAGLKAVAESVADPLKYYDNNVWGAVSLLRAMQRAGCRVMVFSSSATVYGPANEPPYLETMPTGDVANPYGRTKYVIEEMLKDLCRSDEGFSASLLRYFNPIGAHESGQIGEDPEGVPNNLMPLIGRVYLKKQPELLVMGNDYDTPDGTGVRDYIHVMDLAEGHLKALEYAREHPGAEAINLGRGKGYSVLQVIEAFERASGERLPHRFVPRRPGDLASYHADTGKAERLLGGWRAGRGLDEMCRDTWNWLRQNPNGYDEA